MEVGRVSEGQGKRVVCTYVRVGWSDFGFVGVGFK